MNNEIEVSIICNTFNHELYIADALEGFILQKTKFNFEILIHDDASTDHTADIIRNYCEKYPKLIKPIFQKENQYSQGVIITETYQIPRASGKYFAFCEGDDYWTDPYKLQKQYEIMEKHPEVDICAHKTKIVNGKTDELIKYVEPINLQGVLSTEKVIRGGGGFVSSCSLFYRSNICKELPLFRKNYYFDYTLQILGALRGGMMYLPECMAVYRWQTINSWTEQYISDNNKKRKDYIMMKEMFNQLDIDTNYKYRDEIEKFLIELEFHLYESEKRYGQLLDKRFKSIRKKLSLKYQLYILYNAILNNK